MHFIWPNGKGALLTGIEKERPSYERLLSALQGIPGSKASRSWVDRVNPFSGVYHALQPLTCLTACWACPGWMSCAASPAWPLNCGWNLSGTDVAGMSEPGTERSCPARGVQELASDITTHALPCMRGR